MNGERVLVSGAGGWLGGFLVRHLQELGATVTGLDRVASQPTDDRLTVDLAAGAPDLGGRTFDRVFHLAGLAHVLPGRTAAAEAFFRINTEGTQHLLASLSSAPPRVVVHVSTVAVYGRPSGKDLPESTPREAEDPYGLSKIRAEDAVQRWCGEQGVRAVIVRPPLVAGPGCPGNLGAMIASIAAGRYANVAGGRARRSVVAADDLVAGMLVLSDHEGVFHLTDGSHPSYHDLAAALANGLGRNPPRSLPGPLAAVMARAGDAFTAWTGRRAPFDSDRLAKMTSTLTFNDAAACAAIGWRPTRVLDRIDWLLGAADSGGKERVDS